MQIHPESKELLRETLEKYVHDLAEELLYWVEELNKLDAAALEGTDPLQAAAAAETAANRWAARMTTAGATVPASGK